MYTAGQLDALLTQAMALDSDRSETIHDLFSPDRSPVAGLVAGSGNVDLILKACEATSLVTNASGERDIDTQRVLLARLITPRSVESLLDQGDARALGSLMNHIVGDLALMALAIDAVGELPRDRATQVVDQLFSREVCARAAASSHAWALGPLALAASHLPPALRAQAARRVITPEIGEMMKNHGNGETLVSLTALADALEGPQRMAALQALSPAHGARHWQDVMSPPQAASVSGARSIAPSSSSGGGQRGASL